MGGRLQVLRHEQYQLVLGARLVVVLAVSVTRPAPGAVLAVVWQVAPPPEA